MRKSPRFSDDYIRKLAIEYVESKPELKVNTSLFGIEEPRSHIVLRSIGLKSRGFEPTNVARRFCLNNTIGHYVDEFFESINCKKTNVA